MMLLEQAKNDAHEMDVAWRMKRQAALRHVDTRA